MKFRTPASSNGRLCALRIDQGEEVIRTLRRLAEANGIQACRVIATDEAVAG